MWLKNLPPLMARMPSMRPLPSAPARVADPRRGWLKPVPAPTPAEAAPGDAAPDDEAHRARDGGFHESSYELLTGVDIVETEWPDTVPGTLDGPE